MLFGVVVAWRSKRQSIVTLSTRHAETVAICDSITFAQGLSFVKLLIPPRDDLHSQFPPTLTDNTASLDSAESSFRTAGTKHFHGRLRMVSEVRDSLAHVATNLNKADGLTKPGTSQMLVNLVGRVRSVVVRCVSFLAKPFSQRST